MKAILIVLLASISNVLLSQNVVQAEYFLNTDLGVGKNTLVNLTPATDGTFPFTINLSAAAVGYHKLYIRTKDSDGKWSITTKRNIEVVAAVSTVITKGEYFFDVDPGHDAANPIVVGPQDAAILQNFTAVTSALSAGYHKLYIRLKDVHGKWGLTARRNIEIVNPSVWVVAGAEYFFNNDPGFGKGMQVTFTDPLPDGSFSFRLPVENISTGSNTLYLRVRDSVNRNWSLTQWIADSIVTSVQSGLWSDLNTWSNRKIPGSKTVVILHHDVIVDIDAFCKSLTPFRNNVHVTVNQGKVLEISGH